MEKLLADFNANIQGEDIFKLTVRNKYLLEITNDNGISVVNFGT